METLKIDGLTAKKVYPTAPPFFQKILVETFGSAHFIEKITDRIKTFEDACNYLGCSCPLTMEGTKDEVAYKKLKIIIQALNENWSPNWNDTDEKKFYPWWDMENGFVLDYVNYRYTDSYVGSRLCFKSRDLAEYAAKQFHELYKTFLTY